MSESYETPWEHPDIAGVVSIFNGRVTDIQYRHMIVRTEEDNNANNGYIQG